MIQKPDVRLHVEERRLASVNLDGTLKYPGTQRLTWLGVPHMPLFLVKIEEAS